MIHQFRRGSELPFAFGGLVELLLAIRGVFQPSGEGDEAGFEAFGKIGEFPAPLGAGPMVDDLFGGVFPQVIAEIQLGDFGVLFAELTGQFQSKVEDYGKVAEAFGEKLFGQRCLQEFLHPQRGR